MTQHQKLKELHPEAAALMDRIMAIVDQLDEDHPTERLALRELSIAGDSLASRAFVVWTQEEQRALCITKPSKTGPSE